ncbi:transcriptional regulator ATRX-like [Dreissena polymorpha]|nr:transcriptional regulator ATRX-like [Dreissena polymorpha]
MSRRDISTDAAVDDKENTVPNSAADVPMVTSKSELLTPCLSDPMAEFDDDPTEGTGIDGINDLPDINNEQISQNQPVSHTGVPRTQGAAGSQTQGAQPQSADPEKRKLIQQQLALLFHAHKCQRREQNNGEACTLPHCRTMKNVLNHISTCSAGKSCQVAHCASSRQIITHWRNCLRQDCPVCLPFKQASDRQKQTVAVAAAGAAQASRTVSTGPQAKVNAATQQIPSNMNEAQMQKAYAALGLTFNGIQASTSRPGQQNNQVNLGLNPGQSAQVGNSNPTMNSLTAVGGLNATDGLHIVPQTNKGTKQWHESVTQDLRNHLVNKVVQAVFPTQDPAALKDRRMNNLVSYARKVEGDIYETANRRAKKAYEEQESDFEDEMLSDMSRDPEMSFPKLSTPKKGDKSEGKSKGKKSKFEDDISDDSNFVTPKKKKRSNSKIVYAKISDSNYEEKANGKKGAKKRNSKVKRKAEDSSDEDRYTGNRKSKDKKRRRIKRMAYSNEDDIGTDDEDVPDPDTGGYLKRRKIRKVQGQKKLGDETMAAQKAEESRRKRIEERQKEYNAYVQVEGAEEEGDIPEGTEREQAIDTSSTNDKILGSPRKVLVTTKCVLEMDENKKPLIEVDRTLIRKLKPHQVEAVRFMYNCCVERLAILKKEEGAGCILAHCMGLGKTLSVITFVHTMLSNVKLTKMSKCLVVCPLNTCLNWVNEFQIWLDDVDFEIKVYEMSRVKQNFERAQMLKEWHESRAGVMILGYDMYRNFVNGSNCKNEKQKKIFFETLSNPGPDLVVCDEGHILKNDKTSLSKAMNTITSRRRIVLTGTPLQNNLGEYHCMVSFVKPSLLGTRKEFYNRFANPITNGQCSDSTPTDVKVMKRRAHILHKLLAGCVQRKDYSALTKFLPPKMEYVISVRLSKVQMSLYEKYLELSGVTTNPDTKTKGAQLFKDYQALMRIWTHPWVLKLDEIRQENKRQFDDSKDSFIEDEDSKAEDSFINDSTTSDEDDDVMSDDSTKISKKNGAGSSCMDEADMGYGGPKELTSEWWAEFVKEEDKYKLELSGKLKLLFEILKMSEDIGDKVLVFSQSLLSLDIIEDVLAKIDEVNQPEASSDEDNAGNKDGKAGDKPVEVAVGGSEGASSSEIGAGEGASKELSEEDKTAKELKERLSQYGKSWTKGGDYLRMDGSTSSIHRKASQDMFNDPENLRARLFLISTKAGSLGINLVSANRVIIFDASWNPSHDIQSIFRAYRFGQVKPVYVYRFLAQGTMEEKIYERQVTKQSLSQRVVDEHQIERHFTAADLQELYRFIPDRLDDPNRKERPLPILPKDHMLAEISTTNKEWIVTFHEHDSLLENVEEQKLTEDEKKAAWEDYENEKKGINMNRYESQPSDETKEHGSINSRSQGQTSTQQKNSDTTNGLETENSDIYLTLENSQKIIDFVETCDAQRVEKDIIMTTELENQTDKTNKVSTSVVYETQMKDNVYSLRENENITAVDELIKYLDKTGNHAEEHAEGPTKSDAKVKQKLETYDDLIEIVDLTGDDFEPDKETLTQVSKGC